MSSIDLRKMHNWSVIRTHDDGVEAAEEVFGDTIFALQVYSVVGDVIRRDCECHRASETKSTLVSTLF